MNNTELQAQANMATVIRAIMDHSVLTDAEKLHTIDLVVSAALAAAPKVTTFTELS